ARAPDGGGLRPLRARAAHRDPVRPRPRDGPDRGRLPARDASQALRRPAADRRGDRTLSTLMPWWTSEASSGGAPGGGSRAGGTVPVGVGGGEEGALPALPEILPVLPLKNT